MVGVDFHVDPLVVEGVQAYLKQIRSVQELNP
jgi:hypothetical protein